MKLHSVPAKLSRLTSGFVQSAMETLGWTRREHSAHRPEATERQALATP
jgi:hypothetical protein